jgi:hypothetical protein
MKVAKLRRFLQPAAEVRHPFAVPAILAIVGFAVLLVVAMAGGPEAVWAIPVLLWIAAILSFFAALASADIRLERAFPSPRTAFFSLVSFVAFFLAVGVLWLAALDGPLMRGKIYGDAFHSSYRANLLAKGHVGTLTWRTAKDMDAAVTQWAKDEDEIRTSTVQGWFLERPWYRRAFAAETPVVRSLAEKRLMLLSGAAPAWATTSRLCEEGMARMGGSQFAYDYNGEAVRIAKAYTLLLGREIKPADLLPLVPGGRCE